MNALAILLLGAVAVAQTGASGPAFEVASVKPKVVPPGLFYIARSAASKIMISGTRVAVQGPLLHLMAGAYGVEFYQVATSPEWSEKWASRESFEIEAVAPGETTPAREQVRAMLQTLLADRFQLKMHRESKVMPVYNLVVGSGGPKLKPNSSDRAPKMEGEGSVGSEVRVRYTNFSIQAFVTGIMSQFDRPLLDKTGLLGGFDFTLEYRSQPPGMTATTAAALGVSDPDPGLPIVASIQAQLGLKVVTARESVEILVIDHAEKPSAN